MRSRAQTTPDRVAIEGTEEGIRWTYAEMNDQSSAVAAEFAGHPGERIGILLESGPAYAPVLFGIIRSGAVAVPLSTRETADTLTDCIDQAGITALVCDPETESIAAGLSEDVRQASEILEGSSTDSTYTDITTTTEVLVLFTSGSTGRPKGVRLTHGNLTTSAIASAFRLGVTPTDRWLGCLPMYHMGGLAPIVRSTLYGTRLVIQPAFDPQSTAAAVEDHNITGVSLVPTMCRRLLENGWSPPASLRTVLLGGGPIDASLVTRCLEADIRSVRPMASRSQPPRWQRPPPRRRQRTRECWTAPCRHESRHPGGGWQPL
ncbi:MAG: class I adenylate-forming enzyme family protein [Natrialbaceae archaeon]|nr:class I adenylate-forming enzyme family protein [Natrialbaceae archaeon]